MKYLLFATLIVSSFGCQTTSPSVQDQENNSETGIENDVVESPTSVTTANPGEITFTLEILESFTTAKEICGVRRENVLKVRVIEVTEKAMGTSHIPNANDEILLNFIVLPRDLNPTVQLEVRAKEFLCLDASKSYFTVISHKILE